MPDFDTRSVIESAISGSREDSPADGGPESSATVVDDAADAMPAVDDAPEPVDPGDIPDGEGPAKPAEPVKKEEEKPENDDVNAEPEFKTDALGRRTTNKIPQVRVKVMVAKAVEKAVAAKDTEYGEKIKTYEAQTARAQDLDRLVDTDPDRFMRELAEHNPAYKAYIKGGAPAAPAAPVDEPMPPPDGQYPDGTPGYTVEGQKKLEDWRIQQAENRAVARMEKKYGWIDEQKKAHDVREAQIPVIRSQIADARKNWEDFETHSDAILAELRRDSEEAATNRRDPQLTLHDAYRIVMGRNRKTERETHAKELEKLKIDRNKMREEIVAELNGRPRSTATTPAAPVARPDAAADDANKSTRDVIRDAIRRG